MAVRRYLPREEEDFTHLHTRLHVIITTNHSQSRVFDPDSMYFLSLSFRASDFLCNAIARGKHAKSQATGRSAS